MTSADMRKPGRRLDWPTTSPKVTRGLTNLSKKSGEFQTFVLPAAKERGVVELGASELALILEGIDLSNARRRPRWERVDRWVAAP
ncbi:MAG: hypothetical protein K0V04_10100 [Deltaproteobacteria bacterium]|nr:hypothetical protein [Deltaproteobacteria bacterium]